MRKTLACLVAFVALSAAAVAQSSIDDLRKRPDVTAAVAAARRGEPQVLADQVRLTEIPAPHGREERRAAAMRDSFVALGLRNVRIDKVGNVLGERPGRARAPHLVLAAHLDTVFPEGTDVKVTRDGTLLKAPGIADDGRGLAVLLGVIRALDAGKVQTDGTITFVADVGEEGLGDLRGMRELFDRTLKDQVDAFVSIDGTGLGITNQGVGSFRYRVTFTGPGGHSYGDFGLANAVHALGRAVALVADFQVPASPRTTFNVGRIGGGTSINSIAQEAWMEADMRSPDAGALASVDERFRQAIAQAAAAENQRWHDRGAVTVRIDRVGNRPAAHTGADAPIVRVAIAITRAVGASPDVGAGSTDANYPMSLGIPAITIGGGGSGRGAHTLGETFDPTDSARGTERALLLAIALTGGSRSR